MICEQAHSTLQFCKQTMADIFNLCYCFDGGLNLKRMMFGRLRPVTYEIPLPPPSFFSLHFFLFHCSTSVVDLLCICLISTSIRSFLRMVVLVPNWSIAQSVSMIVRRKEIWLVLFRLFTTAQSCFVSKAFLLHACHVHGPNDERWGEKLCWQNCAVC